MSEDEQLAYTVAETGRLLRLGTSTVWKHIRLGRIPALRIGSRTLVTRAAIEALLAEGAPGEMSARERLRMMK
jgi:excisionase family DNA binding protein